MIPTPEIKRFNDAVEKFDAVTFGHCDTVTSPASLEFLGRSLLGVPPAVFHELVKAMQGLKTAQPSAQNVPTGSQRTGKAIL